NISVASDPIGDVPTAVNDSAVTNENTQVQILWLVNDTFGGDGPNSGTIIIASNPTNGIVGVNDNGTPTNPTDDMVTYTPNLNFSGTDSFTYTITDGSGDTSTATVTITVDLVPQPSIVLVKSGAYFDANGDGLVNVGDTVLYNFEVTNTGNVALTNVEVTDAMITVSPVIVGTLAPSITMNVTGTHIITQADLNTGSITNTAVATGNDPSNTPVSDTSDSTDPALPGTDDPTVTQLPQQASISLIKSATINGPGVVGNTITYTLTATNTGNVSLDNVLFNDALTNTVNVPSAVSPLLPGVSTSIQVNHVVTQVDIDNGSVTNSATVNGEDPSNNPVTDTSDSNDPTLPGNDDPTVVSLAPSPSLSLVKVGTYQDANGDGFVNVGDSINYNFTVTNTGNVSLTSIVVNDVLTGTANLPTTPSFLAPGGVATATSSYAITQGDIDAGQVSNTASATGKDPLNVTVGDVSDNGNPLDGNDNPTVTPLNLSPSLALVKSGSVNGTGSVGDTITYTFIVTNNGNATIDNISITDTLLSVGTISVLQPSLAPSESTIGTATYVITQADVDTGSVTNTATVTGTDPSNNPVTDVSDSSDPTLPANNDPTVTNLIPNPSVELVKVGTYEDTNLDGMVDVGDSINYLFTVTNSGNVTLENLSVTDALIPLSPLAVASPLVPGQSATVSAVYPITQTNVNAGQVTNTATVNGTTPGGDPVTDTSDDGNDFNGVNNPTVTPLNQVTELTLVKIGNFNDNLVADGIAQAGETIHYVFTVTNTGNITINNIVINDAVTGTSNAAIVPFSTLAPGQSGTYTVDYSVTQSDVDAGEVINSASTSGIPVNSPTPVGDVSDNDNDPSNGGDTPTVTPLNQSPVIMLVKSGAVVDTDGDGTTEVGETIHYTFTVTNTGNVSVNGIVVNDAIITTSPITVGDLAPGASLVVTGDYTITQSDLNTGSVTNTAVATGTTPTGTPVSDTSDSSDPTLAGNDDPTVTVLTPQPSISLVKSGAVVDTDGDGTTEVGETIHYTFTVTNT
ncbi:MAG: Ig-like domain-containing protein, partial [Flavobacterium sp.]|nr:Ig-like domain-containing protein [Flavobacterium sp.]